MSLCARSHLVHFIEMFGIFVQSSERLCSHSRVRLLFLRTTSDFRALRPHFGWAIAASTLNLSFILHSHLRDASGPSSCTSTHLLHRTAHIKCVDHDTRIRKRPAAPACTLPSSFFSSTLFTKLDVFPRFDPMASQVEDGLCLAEA